MWRVERSAEERSALVTECLPPLWTRGPTDAFCTRSRPFGSHLCQVHCGPGEDTTVARRRSSRRRGRSLDHPSWVRRPGRSGDSPVCSLCQLVGPTCSAAHHGPGLPYRLAPPTKGPAFLKCLFQSVAKKTGLFFLGCGAVPSHRDGECTSPSQRSGSFWGPATMLLRGPGSEWPCCFLLRLSLCREPGWWLHTSFLLQVHVAAYYRSRTLRSMVFTAEQRKPRNCNRFHFITQIFKAKPNPSISCSKCISPCILFKWSVCLHADLLLLC